MSCTALILAAGASRRMGRPKALLTYAGETFLDRLIGIFGRFCSPVIVVLGHQAESIRAGLKREAVTVINPDPERGQLSSMQCGLAAVPAAADAVLFTPVDYPAIEAETVRKLLSALDTNPDALMAIPRFEGRRGHPVVFRRPLAEEFLALPVLTGEARTVVRAHANDAVYVEVDDAGTVTDVDDPAAYQRLVEGVRRT